MTATLRLLCPRALAIARAFALAFPSSEGRPQSSEGPKAQTPCCCKDKGPKGKGQCCCQESGCQTEPKGKGGRWRWGAKGKGDRQEDMQTFQYLLGHRKEITRKVTDLADGVEAVSESGNREVAGKIQEHAAAMHRRLKEGRPIHLRDPLFREVFRHADKIQMRIEKTARGVTVRGTSADAYVASLIQAHARVVSAFLANGHEEVRKDHPIPPRPKAR